jgi:hypothetical protein
MDACRKALMATWAVGDSFEMRGREMSLVVCTGGAPYFM